MVVVRVDNYGLIKNKMHFHKTNAKIKVIVQANGLVQRLKNEKVGLGQV